MSEGNINLGLEALPPTVSVPGRYVFPTYWGGMAISPEPPKIHEGLTSLRRAVGSLAAKKQQGGPMFPVRSAKELMQKLAEALDELGMQAFPISQEVHHFDTANIPSNATASGKPVFRTLAHVKSTVRVAAADGSFADVVGSGHGGDVDDKAGGKADTYAWKSALLKGLCVPEQDMPDTDDEEPSAGPSSDELAFKKAAAKKLDAPGPDIKKAASQLPRILEAVKTADEAQLEELKNEIQSGAAALTMPEKLKASAAFVARRKVLEDAKAGSAE